MKKDHRKKILCIAQLPPPVHGASMMNNYVVNSDVLNRNYTLEVINLQFAKSLEDIDNFSFRKIWRTGFYALKLLNKLIFFNPDLVYFPFSPLGFAFYRDFGYALMVKIFRKKMVLHFHVKGINKRSENSKFYEYLYRFIFRNTSIIYLTKGLSKDIKNVYKSDPFIIPNGIPWISSATEKKRVQDNVPVILYLSNYKETKGIVVLIEALQLLMKQHKSFKARLVGAPSDLNIEDLNTMIREKKLTAHVTVTGPKYDLDKHDEFRNADIFIFPTFYKKESFPLVILEAMQYKLPVISTFEGGIPDIIIDHETGFLVEKRNPQMLASKITELIDDQQLRKRMGEKGYERFKNNYSISHFENNLYHTFEELLNK